MNLVSVHTRLDMLANFFERVTVDACQELASIEDRRLAGDFASLEAYENAVDRPFARVDIAARAVAYEVVAFIEAELHRLAYEPWLKSATHKGPKNIFQLSRVNAETRTKLRMVSDLPFDEVVALVNDHFSISLADIEGWSTILELRDAVNAFKHRQGVKHPRDINWRSEDRTLCQRYTIDQGQVIKILGDVASFFKALKRSLHA